MKLKTLIALAVAGAFAVPMAAQASADGDKFILAQSGGPAGASATGTGPTGGVPSPRTAGEPKAPTSERGATAGASRGMTPDFSTYDRNGDGQISRAEWNAVHGSASGRTGASSGATTSPSGSASGSSTTGTTAGPGSASNRTGTGSDTATTPSTSGHGKPQ
jgi:hypothetical protein